MIKYFSVPASTLAISLAMSVHASAGISDVIFDTFASPDKSIATEAKRKTISHSNDEEESELIFFYSPDNPKEPKVLRVYRSQPTVVDDVSYMPDISFTDPVADEGAVPGERHPDYRGINPIGNGGKGFTVEQTLQQIEALQERQLAQQTQQDNRLNTMETRLDRLNRDVKHALEGATIAMAMATTPQATDGRNMIGFGAAYFEGKQGLNIGMSSNFGDEHEHTIKFNIGSAGSTTAGAVGYGYSW